jgi:hypothetical protein
MIIVELRPVAFVVEIAEWDYVRGYIIKDYQLFTDFNTYINYLVNPDELNRHIVRIGRGLQLIGDDTKSQLEAGGGYACVKNYRL